MNKSIELVVHVFAGKLPLYADHLRFQWASIMDNDPDVEVHYTLFWAGPEHDPITAKLADLEADNFYINSIILPREQLFRRAIGRHQRSQATECDVIWYCDADMYFGEGAIDSVCQQVQDDGRLYFPRRTMMSIDHEAGQKTLEAAAGTMWPTINPDDFKPQRNFFAIGGIQILGRETAKRVGYFGFKEGEPGYHRRHTKWFQPVDPEKPFAEFRDDAAWRRHHFAGDKQVKIDVPELYRLRHELSSLRPAGFKDDATVPPSRRK